MADKNPKFGLMSRKVLFGTTVGVSLFFMIVGVIFWGGFNTAMEATNTMTFCISCHEMEDNVYAEYQNTIHYTNRSGVQATCSDCHVPDPWVHKVVRKVQASRELLHKALGTIDTPEKFDKHRLSLAMNVWNTMKATDSRECRNCHDFNSMNPENQKGRAQKQHINAMQAGNTCIDCHKGIAHKKVHDQLTEAELEELERPDPNLIRPIPSQWAVLLEDKSKDKQKAVEVVAAEMGDATEETQSESVDVQSVAATPAAVSSEAETDITAEPTEQVQTESTSEEEPLNLAQSDTANAAEPVAAPSTSTAEQSGSDAGSEIDWDGIEPAEITLFYPGQASMEWILKGSDHGGKRAFTKGDRCLECHEDEEVDIGDLIVIGDKVEPTPIPGKRGSIPMQIQTAYDDAYLYMRFQWAQSAHAPVPFVDGGKMDPDNQIKLALMITTDSEDDPKVEYAERAGCWQSCHHDANNMPHQPDAEILTASPLAQRLDLSRGITKYLKESRTEIETEGKNDKPRGGWDKLKDESEIQAALENGAFMDLLRFKSGTGESEDGYILAERVMEGGQGVDFIGTLDGDTWTVEMKRKLTSDQLGDISMATDQLYNIGFAIHDDYSSSRFHHVSLGFKLGFDNEDAEINAISK